MNAMYCNGCSYLSYEGGTFYCYYAKCNQKAMKWGRRIRVERIRRCNRKNK